MKRVDRIVLVLLAAGVWVLGLGLILHSHSATADPPRPVWDIENIVEDVVEDCDVRGEVYIYDRESGYGEIDSARIDC